MRRGQPPYSGQNSWSQCVLPLYHQNHEVYAINIYIVVVVVNDLAAGRCCIKHLFMPFLCFLVVEKWWDLLEESVTKGSIWKVHQVLTRFPNFCHHRQCWSSLHPEGPYLTFFILNYCFLINYVATHWLYSGPLLNPWQFWDRNSTVPCWKCMHH